MNLTLIRQKFEKECTHGVLLVDGARYCDTLEPHAIDWEKEKKVDGKTAIPEGTYRIVMGWSSRYRRLMPFLENVPHFSAVMVHTGNTNSDTRGCILVGVYSRRNFIAHSRDTFEPLRDAIAHAYAKHEDIFIEIVPFPSEASAGAW